MNKKIIVSILFLLGVILLSFDAMAACSPVALSACGDPPSTQVACSSNTWTGTTYTFTQVSGVGIDTECAELAASSSYQMDWLSFGGVTACFYCNACTSTSSCSTGDRAYSSEFGGTLIHVGYCDPTQTGSAVCSTGSSYYKECCLGSTVQWVGFMPQNADGSWPVACYDSGGGSHYNPNTDPYVAWYPSPGCAAPPPPACGAAGQPCCSGSCNSPLTCNGGTCGNPPPSCSFNNVRCGGYDGPAVGNTAPIPYAGGLGCGGAYQDVYACSDGTFNVNSVCTTAACLAACRTCNWCNVGSGDCSVPPPPPVPPPCGNGVINSGEQCDDSNMLNGDGCSSTCVIEGCCGNRICDAGETTVNCPGDNCPPPPCTCSWVSGACGASGSCPTGSRRWTQSCSGSGCTSPPGTMCVGDSTCPVCTVGAWGPSGICGAGGCAANQRPQTRTVTNCDPPIPASLRCVNDATCVPPPPACTGSVALTLTPTSTPPSGSITPTSSGLTACSTQTVFYRQGSCAGATVSSCLSTGTGCQGPNFPAPSIANPYTYFACVDKDGEGDFADAGEQGSAILTVTNSCTGPLSLVLNPSTTGKLSPVSPFGGNLATCSGKNINFKLGSCNSGVWVSNCSAGAIGCTGTSFNSPNSFGSFRYSGCIDINNDGDTNDAGENATATLAVSSLCSANLALSLSPTSTTWGASVTPTASGLSGCNGYNVEFRSGSCAGVKQTNCSASGVGCSGPGFIAPSADGVSSYFACIDANSDGDFIDAGEFASASLTVNSCFGAVALALAPSTASPSTAITPTSSGLLNCTGKSIEYHEVSCAGTLKSSCVSGVTGCSGPTFTAPASNGVYPYYACINKNGANGFADAGEQGTASLSVSSCSQTTECDVCLSDSTGQPCQCGSECNSQFCRPLDDTCADCTTNADCTSPPDACTQEQGQCVAGACVYPVKTTNRPDCCSCSGAAECLAGVCNGAGNCSNSASCGGSGGGGGGGGGSCDSVEPLANCGGASCPTCVVGTVTSYTGVAQQGATVKYDNTLTYIADAVGFYFFYNIALGSHVLQAIPAAPWVPTTVTRNLHRAINSVDLVVGTGSSSCEADCTLIGSTACVASCDGTNGCSYASATVKATCDGLQKGFIRDIGGGNQVVCCSGAISPVVNIQSIARVNGTNAITVTRNVFYAGKLVKMKIVVFN